MREEGRLKNLPLRKKKKLGIFFIFVEEVPTSIKLEGGGKILFFYYSNVINDQ